MENSIEVKGFSKHYPNFKIEDFSFVVPSGSIVGLVGENGAGKTTLIKSILGSIQKEAGEIFLFGKPISHSSKDEIGVVLDGSFFAELLKVSDVNLVMKDVYPNWDTSYFFELLTRFSIPNHQTIKTLSKGMRKKLEIVTALSHHPKLLILDEPTSGLDPVVRNEILDLFLEFIGDEDHSILLSSHITSDLERIADYIAFIEKGELIFEKTKEELMEEYGMIRCDQTVFEQLPKEAIVRYQKNRYNYDVLTNQKPKIRKQHPNIIIDPIKMEEIMVLYSKGEKK